MHEPLDNAVWEALGSRHRHLAIRSGRAACYPAEVSPLAALEEPSEAALADMAANVPSGVGIGIVGIEHLAVDPARWEIGPPLRLVQMVCEARLEGPEALAAGALGQGDAGEMLTLTEATQPGPFLVRTVEMGRYLGVRDGSRLIAMAGERLALDGYTEISAVCTNPDFRGRGLGEKLVRAIGAGIQSTGRVPFLHVLESNEGAIALYRKLGFAARMTGTLTTLLRR